MDSGSAEIAFDCDEFRLYKDGHAVRAGWVQDTVPAGFDADTGVTSKDVVIDAATGVAARLYLPNIQTAPSARVVAVSVRYRLAPEHLLPAAYDDAWAALNWAASGADPWLSEHGDRDRVFVAGVSAGANIAHNMAIAAGVSGLKDAAKPLAPARVEGVILLHPSFAAAQKMEAEAEEFWQANKKRWTAIFPGAKDGLDDPRINPMAADATSLTKLVGERLLVCTASEDSRAPWVRAYRDAVRASGWRGEVQSFESDGEGHGFFVSNPSSREAVKLMERLVAFVTEH
ncbi:hypothetical protein EJB05_43305, partial [Eragrostis curvula]